MLKRRKFTAPKKHDYTALDAAALELSKQTAALLGTDEEEKPEKPALPKKNATPRRRGHSFDIIQGQPAPRAAHLKTAVPQKQKELQPEHELLPEHAGLSFNEQHSAPASMPNDDTSVAASESATTITSHKIGLLSSEPVIETSVADSTQSKKTEEAGAKDASEESNSPGDDSNPTVSEKALSFEEEPKLTPVEPQTQPNSSPQTSETSESAQSDESAPVVETPSYESAGIYANNLVNNKNTKGYEPRESQQMPTVFDTNEYHQELHDWSKLDGGSGSKVVLLLLLLIVAGAAAYFVISGQQLLF